MPKYFKPIDFSEFEMDEPAPTASIKSNKIEIPTKVQLNLIRDRINTELKKCEEGTSKLSNIAIQPKTTAGTKNLLIVMLNDFNKENVLDFLKVLKQDYGLRVAEWAALEVLGPYCQEVIQLAGEWRNG